MENVRTIAGGAAPRIPPETTIAGGAAPRIPPETTIGGALGERERSVLDFERRFWRHAGAKEEAIRRELGVAPTAYYQLLCQLIDDPAAIAYDPMLVKRLQRQRASRRRQRSRGRLSPHPSGGS